MTKEEEQRMREQTGKATYQRWPVATIEQAESGHNMRMEFGLGFERGYKNAFEHSQLSVNQYAQQQSIAFAEWVTHNDWVYLPSKNIWLNEEQEEKLQPLTGEQLYNLFINSQEK
jgi:hypothetical protein